MIVVHTNLLGSRMAQRAGIDSFAMRPFNGAALIRLKDCPRGDLNAELRAFIELLEENIDADSCDTDLLWQNLTVFDVWQLVVMMWMESKVPLVLGGTCTHPVYNYAHDGDLHRTYHALEIPEGGTVTHVEQCGGGAAGHIVNSDVRIRYVRDDVWDTLPHPDVTLPLAIDYLSGEYDYTNRRDMLLLCLSRVEDIDDQDPALFMKTVQWLNGNWHGVVSDALMVCGSCGRALETKWHIGIETFLG